MTDTAEPSLPEQLDGEPNLTAEIARLDAEIKALTEQLTPSDEELKADMEGLQISDEDYAKLLASLDELISAEDRPAAPTAGPRMDQLMWRVSAAAKAMKRSTVPPTDGKRAALDIPGIDFSALPAHARIARGYRA